MGHVPVLYYCGFLVNIDVACDSASLDTHGRPRLWCDKSSRGVHFYSGYSDSQSGRNIFPIFVFKSLQTGVLFLTKYAGNMRYKIYGSYWILRQSAKDENILTMRTWGWQAESCAALNGSLNDTYKQQNLCFYAIFTTENYFLIVQNLSSDCPHLLSRHEADLVELKIQFWHSFTLCILEEYQIKYKQITTKQ